MFLFCSTTGFVCVVCWTKPALRWFSNAFKINVLSFIHSFIYSFIQSINQSINHSFIHWAKKRTITSYAVVGKKFVLFWPPWFWRNVIIADNDYSGGKSKPIGTLLIFNKFTILITVCTVVQNCYKGKSVCQWKTQILDPRDRKPLNRSTLNLIGVIRSGTSPNM